VRSPREEPQMLVVHLHYRCGAYSVPTGPARRFDRRKLAASASAARVCSSAASISARCQLGLAITDTLASAAARLQH
jgi:hypothetical protein